MRWGETAVERSARREARNARLQAWHPHFAWCPVRLHDGSWVWLEWVHRRRLWSEGIGWEGDGAGWWYQYRTSDKIDKS